MTINLCLVITETSYVLFASTSTSASALVSIFFIIFFGATITLACMAGASASTSLLVRASVLLVTLFLMILLMLISGIRSITASGSGTTGWASSSSSISGMRAAWSRAWARWGSSSRSGSWASHIRTVFLDMARFTTVIAFLFTSFHFSTAFFSAFICPMSSLSTFVAFVVNLRSSGFLGALLASMFNNKLTAIEFIVVHFINSIFSISGVVKFQECIALFQDDISDFAEFSEQILKIVSVGSSRETSNVHLYALWAWWGGHRLMCL